MSKFRLSKRTINRNINHHRRHIRSTTTNHLYKLNSPKQTTTTSNNNQTNHKHPKHRSRRKHTTITQRRPTKSKSIPNHHHHTSHHRPNHSSNQQKSRHTSSHKTSSNNKIHNPNTTNTNTKVKPPSQLKYPTNKQPSLFRPNTKRPYSLRLIPTNRTRQHNTHNNIPFPLPTTQHHRHHTITKQTIQLIKHSQLSRHHSQRPSNSTNPHSTRTNSNHITQRNHILNPNTTNHLTTLASLSPKTSQPHIQSRITGVNRNPASRRIHNQITITRRMVTTHRHVLGLHSHNKRITGTNNSSKVIRTGIIGSRRQLRRTLVPRRPDGGHTTILLPQRQHRVKNMTFNRPSSSHTPLTSRLIPIRSSQSLTLKIKIPKITTTQAVLSKGTSLRSFRVLKVTRFISRHRSQNQTTI